jgi:hypothetical protein
MSSSKFRRFSAATTAPMRRFTPLQPRPAIDKYQFAVGTPDEFHPTEIPQPVDGRGHAWLTGAGGLALADEGVFNRPPHQ